MLGGHEFGTKFCEINKELGEEARVASSTEVQALGLARVNT